MFYLRKRFLVALALCAAGFFQVSVGADLDKARALLKSGTTFVPVRAIFEWLGAEVGYEKGVITVSRGNDFVQLTVGKAVASKNGKEIRLQNPPFVSNGVTYVPLRFVAEAFGAEVQYDRQRRTVTIKTGGRSTELKVEAESASERVVIGYLSDNDIDFLYLVGVYERKRGWLEQEQVKTSIPPGLRFTTLTRQGIGPKVATVSKPQSEEGMGYWMKLTSRPDGEALALAGAANPCPRRARPCSDLAAARRVAEQALAMKGFSSRFSGVIDETWWVDLDGDLQEELLVAARGRQPDNYEDVRRGDYALVALRFKTGTQTKILPLYLCVAEGEADMDGVSRFKFLAVADIDGDGKMEVILSRELYEGTEVKIFRFDGSQAQSVLEADWGF